MKKSILNEIRQVLFPDDIKCIVCGREMHKNRYGLCSNCALDLNENFCLRCGRHKVGIGDYCDECADKVMYFDAARSAVSYDGNAKTLVRRLKYGNARYLARALTEYMLDTLLFTDWQFDCMTYVPMFKKREAKRGYNQARLLADELSERVNSECVTLLEKIKNTRNQASLAGTEREKNVIGAFSAVGKPPKSVLLIDDVMTTGTTASECAKVLKKAGANIIYLLTFASVPERPLLDKKVTDIKSFKR